MKRLAVVVAKFEDDEYEEGETAIRVVELDTEMNGLDVQWWCEDYNKNHDEQIEDAKFYSLDYLKDRWEHVK